VYGNVLFTVEVCYGWKKFVTREIMNVDETEITAQTKPSNVVAERGKEQAGANNSSKCGVLSAVVIYMSAGGKSSRRSFLSIGENEGRNEI